MRRGDVANTDSITVNGAAGATETLVVDQSGGAFAPGQPPRPARPRSRSRPLLGDASDLVIVHGTTGADAISIGLAGIALNADGDADLTFSTLPARIEVFGHGGPNTINGRGGSGAGATYTGMLVLHAGDSGDTLTGGSGNDELYGGARRRLPDRLHGRRHRSTAVAAPTRSPGTMATTRSPAAAAPTR